MWTRTTKGLFPQNQLWFTSFCEDLTLLLTIQAFKADINRYLLLIRLCCIRSGDLQPPESTHCFVFLVITNTTTPTCHTQLVQSQNVLNSGVAWKKGRHDLRLERHCLTAAAGMSDGMNRPGGDSEEAAILSEDFIKCCPAHWLQVRICGPEVNPSLYPGPETAEPSQVLTERGFQNSACVDSEFGFWLTVCWTSFLVHPECHRVQIHPDSTVIPNVRVCVAPEVWLWQKLTGLACEDIAYCNHAKQRLLLSEIQLSEKGTVTLSSHLNRNKKKSNRFSCGWWQVTNRKVCTCVCQPEKESQNPFGCQIYSSGGSTNVQQQQELQFDLDDLTGSSLRLFSLSRMRTFGYTTSVCVVTTRICFPPDCVKLIPDTFPPQPVYLPPLSLFTENSNTGHLTENGWGLANQNKHHESHKALVHHKDFMELKSKQEWLPSENTTKSTRLIAILHVRFSHSWADCVRGNA